MHQKSFYPTANITAEFKCKTKKEIINVWKIPLLSCLVITQIIIQTINNKKQRIKLNE